MSDLPERLPLLDSTSREEGDGQRGRKASIVSFAEQGDSGNPLEWSKKYKWFSVVLLCLFAAVVYDHLSGLLQLELMVKQDIYMHWHRSGRRGCRPRAGRT